MAALVGLAGLLQSGLGYLLLRFWMQRRGSVGDPMVREIFWGQLSVGLVTAALLVLGFSLMWQRIHRRVERSASFARGVVAGDLKGRIEVQAMDELGELEDALGQLNLSLSSVLSGVGGVAVNLAGVSARIKHSSIGVARGAEAQWHSIRHTRDEVDSVAQALRDTARTVDTISHRAQESTASALDIATLNTEVSGDLGRLSGAVSTVETWVVQVSEKTSTMAQHVEVLGQAAAETGAAIGRTESALQQVRRLADRSSSIAAGVSTEAAAGALAVSASLGAMTELERAMAAVREATSGLTNRLTTVGTFLQAIADIARRTNLLSLNAAIIASQAGEHGRSFQVVASEVKGLAAQTAGLTRDIEREIEEIAAAGEVAHGAVAGASETVVDGGRQVQKAGDVLQQILGATAHATELSTEIAGSMAERESDLGRVTRAMERVLRATADIGEVTRAQVRTATQARESASAIAEVFEAVNRSTEQQLAGSERIGHALAEVSRSVALLSRTQSEQATSGERILADVEAIRGIAEALKGESQTLEQTLEVLLGQVAELRTQIERFTARPPRT